MQYPQGKLIEALDRVEEFLERNREVTSTVITSVAHQNLSASRTRLVEHMTAQNEHARGIRSTVAAKRTLRDRLIQAHMRPISIIARAQLPDVEQFGALTVQPGNQQYVELVATALGMARAAKLHEATFVASGLPEDFIAKLVAAAEALKVGIADKGQTSARRVRATFGLKDEARIARTSLRFLDALLRAALTDKALLAEWRVIRRVAVAATKSEELDATPDAAGGTEGTSGATPAGDPGASDAAPTGPRLVVDETREEPAVP